VTRAGLALPRGRHLIVNPTEAERVTEAAKRLLESGEPMHSIVVDWNGSGVLTRSGKHWRQSNLLSILMNRSMLGETKASVIDREPILDARTFERLGLLSSEPARKHVDSPGVKGGKYSMGGGLTVCGKCGKPLTSQHSADARAASLICNKQVQGPHEAHPSVERVIAGRTVLQDTGRVRIDHDSLEAYVFGKVITLLENTPRWRQRMSEPNPDSDAKIDALEADRSDLRAQRERAGKEYVAGIVSEAESKREVDRIERELESVSTQIDALLGRPALSNIFKDGLDWLAWTPGQRRAALRDFIDRIVLNDWPKGVPATCSARTARPMPTMPHASSRGALQRWASALRSSGNGQLERLGSQSNRRSTCSLGGTMIEWESHETGKRFGGLFPSEQGTQIMIEEGLNPYEFEQALGL
jgi:site-specific DNA recombinase